MPQQTPSTSGHLACLTAVGSTLVIWMRYTRPVFSIWELPYTLLHVLLFGCKVFCSPNTQALVHRVGVTGLSSPGRVSADLTQGSSLRSASSPYFFLYTILELIMPFLNFEVDFKILYYFVTLSVDSDLLDQLFCLVYKYFMRLY